MYVIDLLEKELNRLKTTEQQSDYEAVKDAIDILNSEYRKQEANEIRLQKIYDNLNPMPDTAPEHLIWSNRFAGMDSDIKSLIENDREVCLGCSVSDLIAICIKQNQEDRAIQIEMLQAQFESIYKTSTFHCLCLADIEQWHGRTKGYKICRNITWKDLFALVETDEGDFYYDGTDLKATGYHHDGVNYYTFRRIITDDLDSFTDNFADIWSTENIESELDRTTESLAIVPITLYGWESEKKGTVV